MIYEILSNLYIVSFLAVIGPFILVRYMIPKISWMVNYHDLIEQPNKRSSHRKPTPTMGGAAFFVILILSSFLFKHFDADMIGLNFVAAITIIFIIGLKDDLAATTPRARIGAEIIAISIILFHTGMQIYSLDGFLGLYIIPKAVLDVFAIIIVLTIINAFNLIDGIDGLAAFIGIVIFSTYAPIFYVAGFYFYFLICLSLIGILTSYSFYNFSSKNKIFMGDTGSLTIGFCIGFMSLRFLTMDASLFGSFTFKPENKLIVIAAIVSIPLFDLLRVAGVRLLNKQSPFHADRNHIHHILLDLGLKHYHIALLLGTLNYVLIILLVFLASIYTSFEMVCILVVIFVLLLGIFYKLKSSIKKKENSLMTNEVLIDNDASNKKLRNQSTIKKNK